MPTLHEFIVFYINLEHREKQEWLPEIPEDTAAGGVNRFTDDKIARKVLRLMANSAIEVLRIRAEEEQFYSDFRRELQRIRPINSQAKVLSANNRLLKLYEWETEENGENAGSCYSSAAALTDALLTSYNGWPLTEVYEDVTSHYATVAGSIRLSPDRQKLVLQLLDELKKIEGK
ncbi:hypothetical protein ACIOHC_35685 [Streptomyces sp. NPDC088252]|uniref:hypothetical protein n=1 Tax=Streptomyces sp. NPDC088252 TaxID=3365845 RepID=UPI003817DDA8